jgi:superfamily II DNA or RNA helicase
MNLEFFCCSGESCFRLFSQSTKVSTTNLVLPAPVGIAMRVFFVKSSSQHIMRMLTEEDFTKKTLIAIPTGAGKTRLVVETLVDWLNSRKQDSPEQQKNSKFIIWLAHSHELCEQAIDAFKQIYHAKGKTALNIHRFFGAGGELPAGTEFEDLLPENGVIVATISSF